MSDARKKGPYGCKCQTLAHKLTGDGCDECQPTWRTDMNDALKLEESVRAARSALDTLSHDYLHWKYEAEGATTLSVREENLIETIDRALKTILNRDTTDDT